MSEPPKQPEQSKPEPKPQRPENRLTYEDEMELVKVFTRLQAEPWLLGDRSWKACSYECGAVVFIRKGTLLLAGRARLEHLWVISSPQARLYPQFGNMTEIVGLLPRVDQGTTLTPIPFDDWGPIAGPWIDYLRGSIQGFKELPASYRQKAEDILSADLERAGDVVRESWKIPSP